MTSTEYLFGHPKEHYGPHLEDLARERIADARALISKLYQQINYDPKDQNEKQVKLRRRIRKVSEAIEVWKKILEVEEY